MKIGILSFYTDEYQRIADIQLPLRDSYCKKQEYEHLIYKGVYKNKNWYYAFSRLSYILDLFIERPDLEAIFCLNLQSSIMNHNIRIERFVDKEHDFFITKDNGEKLINAGSFIIKNTEVGRNWLKHILSFEAIHQNHCQQEQNIIANEIEHPDFKDKIKILPQNTINSYWYPFYNWSESTSGNFVFGQFILSIPGKAIQYDNSVSLLDSRIDILNSSFVKDNMIL